mgnify:FL=1
MLEILSQHIDTLLAFITGGGVLSFATLKFTRKQAEADAMKAVQEVYQETIKDLREDKELMGKELSDLRVKVAGIYKDLAVLRKYKCTDLDCKHRKID